MLMVGIRELKNNLSRYLVAVKGGADLVITERGRPVARIVPESAGSQGEIKALADLSS